MSGLRDTRIAPVQGITQTQQIDKSQTSIAQNEAAVKGLNFAVQVAEKASSELKKAAELSDDDKKEIEAKQAANVTYNENAVTELSSGVDRIIGKAAKREKYAKELAANNAAGQYANTVGSSLEDYAEMDTGAFVDKVDKDFRQWAEKAGISEESQDYKNAYSAMRRQLPQLAGRHAQVNTNYKQAEVYNAGIESASLAIDKETSILGGNSPKYMQEEAAANLGNMFKNAHVVEPAVDGIAPTTVESKQAMLTGALVRQLAAGNTSAYMIAKQHGFVDHLNEPARKALDAAVVKERVSREKSLNLGVDRRINNATESGDLNELAIGMQEINKWADTGFDTDEENLAYEAARKDLLLAQARLQPKASKKEVIASQINELISVRDNKAAIASKNFSKEVREGAADETMRLRAQDAVKQQGGGVVEVALEDALNITVGDRELLSAHIDDAIQYGNASPSVSEYITGLMESLPAQLDSEVGISQVQNAQLKNLVDTASSRPTEFAKLFGADVLAQMTIAKAHNGNPKVMATALRTYTENKAMPTALDQLGVETKLRKSEWIMQELGIRDYSQSTASYFAELFDKGVKARGTVQGGVEFAKVFQTEIDDEYEGTVIRDGKVYSQKWLQGEGVNSVLKALEQPIDSNGNTLLTAVVMDRLPEGSNVTRLSDLPDLTIQADSITGDITVVSGSMFAPIRIEGNEVSLLMQEAEVRAKAYEDAEAYILSQRRFTGMNYTQRNTTRETLDNYSYVTKDPKSGWDNFNKAAGRESKKILRDMGILPDDVSSKQDFIPNPVPLVQSVSEVAQGTARRPEGYMKDVEQIAARVGMTSRDLAEVNAISSEAPDILRHEGYKETVFTDTKGHPTWGIGFKLTDAQLDTGEWIEGKTRPSKESVVKQFKGELATAKRIANNYLMSAGITEPSEEMTNILTNMAYNHGDRGLAKYKKMQSALMRGNATQVIFEMMDSDWYASYRGKQLDRANELVERMTVEMQRQGDWIWEN